MRYNFVFVVFGFTVHMTDKRCKRLIDLGRDWRKLYADEGIFPRPRYPFTSTQRCAGKQGESGKDDGRHHGAQTTR